MSLKPPKKSDLNKGWMKNVSTGKSKSSLTFMVKGIIHSACLKKPKIVRVKTRTGISMFGWFMIQMISRQIMKCTRCQALEEFLLEIPIARHSINYYFIYAR